MIVRKRVGALLQQLLAALLQAPSLLALQRRDPVSSLSSLSGCVLCCRGSSADAPLTRPQTRGRRHELAPLELSPAAAMAAVPPPPPGAPHLLPVGTKNACAPGGFPGLEGAGVETVMTLTRLTPRFAGGGGDHVDCSASLDALDDIDTAEL